ncbi:MAG: FkbM family methyltransferase [Oscillospiraceae bacterium]|nr:FkbM family methyltransferase [Oscillospiraceae bacterium]
MKQTFADTYLPAYSAKQILENMQDDESRRIFLWRYDYFVSRNEEKMSEKSNIFEIENISGAVNIFGAGALSEIYTIPLLKSKGMKINSVYDSNRAGKSINGYDIIALNEMLRSCDLPIIISTFSERVCVEMKEVLLSHGVSADLIIEPKSFVYDGQYFIPEIIKPVSDEIFIDAGCMDGDSSLKFREFTKDFGYKRIYAFEPDIDCYEKSSNIFKDNALKNVTLIQKGLWDSADTLCFNSADMGSSTISDEGEMKIETVPLDEVVDSSDKVTFIKMDIEGAELNALYGAREIIKRDKPRLAICVYHKPEDIIYLASFILELNPEYKFFLRHHSPLPMLETVLYAV